MKYTYRSKTYKLKNKLKIILTILLAALITTTGYLLSRDVLSKLDYEYFNETTTDGINIKVVGERGVIPNNSTLKIEKVSKEEKDSVDDSINKIKDRNMNTIKSYTYDIKILDEENNEIEPSDEIKIIFTNDLINNKNLDTNIYHTSTNKNNNLTTEVLIGEIKKDTITTKTDSFSYYTVEFTYNNLTYSIEGDSEVKLSSILEQLGLEGEVTFVEGSNDSLFSFEKKDNEWYVKANQAFQTREWMKVTIDGIEYEIIVTDAVNYTITYQSGSDGKFEGGTTTNVVSYSKTEPQQVTKYSHTPNVDDTGLQNGNYANSLNTNEVVTIPGATTLTVDIYYNGESVSYDWLSVWAGNYPSYTASSNRTSTGYVTTDMGAPNNNNKFGGSQTGTYTVNGNTLSNMGHTTLTIAGDSVTFGFKSDSSGVGNGYGYYAIVSGIGETRTITSGTYKEPIANNSEYRFKEWSQDPNTISTNATLTAIYAEDLLNSSTKGTYDGVDWKIKYDGTLVIGKTGTTQSYTNRTTRWYYNWPWWDYKDQITKIKFIGSVNGNGSHDYMFDQCSIATNITNLSYFNTSNVTSMSSMFADCSSLTSLDITNFNTSNVTNFNSMFAGCSSLTSLDVTNFNTNKATDIGQIFWNCKSLTSIDVSNFDTRNVVNMQNVFAHCSGLTSLDISNFNTNKVTNMEQMFWDCSRLTSLNLSNFNTSNVTNMGSMFSNCSNLKSLDISSFNTNKVTDMEYMFSSTSKLNTLKLGTNWRFLSDNRLANSWQREGDSTIYTAEELTANYNGTTMAGTYTWPKEAYAEFDSSNGRLRIFRDPGGSYTNNQVIGTKTYYAGLETIINNTYPKWYSKSANITSVVIEDEFKPQTAYNMFSGCTNLITITGIEYLDTSDVTNMGVMFGDCKRLTSLELSSFNTSNVVDMSFMFDGCSSLTSLDLSNFNTSNVTDMHEMFYNCSSLTSLDLSSFNTKNITNMSYLFYKCSNLISLDLSSFNTSNVTTMFCMFYNCSKLTALNVSSFNTNNVTDLSNMFEGCSSLTNLDLSNFNTSNVTNIRTMFHQCSSLISLNLSNFDTSNVTDMAYLFCDCENLTSLNLSNFNTSNVTTMQDMFNNCSRLTILDLSSFDASNVTNMQYMFLNTTKLNTLKLGSDWKFLVSNKLEKSWLRDGDTIRYTAAELTNSYNGSTMAGTYRAVQRLTITETLKGTLANINKNFDFTINVTNDGVGINSTHAYTGTKSGNLIFSNGVASFTLKHNDSISTYLPYGVNYTITQNSDGYTLSKTNDTGTLSTDRTASFTDTLNGTTPTGIFLDLIPFIILIIFGTFGIFLIRKFKYI